MSVIPLPWVFLSLGDHAPAGRRPIYYRERGEASAQLIGEVYMTRRAGEPLNSSGEIMAEAMALYNDKKNAEARS